NQELQALNELLLTYKLPNVSFLQILKIFDQEQLLFLSTYLPSYAHDITMPTLSFQGLKNLFLESPYSLSRNIPGWSITLLYKNGQEERTALFLKGYQLFKKERSQLLTKCNDPYSYELLCSLRSLYQHYEVFTNPKTELQLRLASYTHLRSLGVLNKNINFLNECWSSIFRLKSNANEFFIRNVAIASLSDQEWDLFDKYFKLLVEKELISSRFDSFLHKEYKQYKKFLLPSLATLISNKKTLLSH
ncbi:MAG: hypothetical protein HQK50_17820, partial [Oligoflexia bacterium]|nr:hypothetical protein [Oligoflexia bacterium]